MTDADKATLVYWEDDPSRTRLLAGWCKRCFPNGPEPPAMLVSPTGLAHHTTYGDTTDCGHDAVGENWWWRT